MVIVHHLILIIEKISFLVLGEGPNQVINDNTGSAGKKICVNFNKANTKFSLRLHYNWDESYLIVNKTEICKFKAKDNISWYTFCLGSVSKDFAKDEQSEISFNGTVFDFSVGHSSIKEEDILHIHQYLMIKTNIK